VLSILPLALCNAHDMTHSVRGQWTADRGVVLEIAAADFDRRSKADRWYAAINRRHPAVLTGCMP
jgi:hypothetical protein